MTAEDYFELTNDDWDCLRHAWESGLKYAVRVAGAAENALSRDRLEILARNGLGYVLARTGVRFLVMRDGESRGVEVTALVRQLLLTRNGISLLEGIALRLVCGERDEALRLLRRRVRDE